MHSNSILIALSSLIGTLAVSTADVGVGTKTASGATVLIDGSRTMLDEQWTYWEGPRFASSLPIKWKVVDDPVTEGKQHHDLRPSR